ncbi:hypothetical protein [Labilibaculum euxinus]
MPEAGGRFTDFNTNIDGTWVKNSDLKRDGYQPFSGPNALNDAMTAIQPRKKYGNPVVTVGDLICNGVTYSEESPSGTNASNGAGENMASFAPAIPLGVGLTLEGSGAAVAINPLVIVGTLPFVLSGDTRQEPQNYSYVVYIKTHSSGNVYVGRSSGTGTPDQVVKRRDASHHMNALGYGPAVVHSALMNVGSLIGYPAMRGREQQVIDFYGGVANTGNSIRGVSPYNPLGKVYWGASNLSFGPLMPYNGY